jgi:hypothetical protein
MRSQFAIPSLLVFAALCTAPDAAAQTTPPRLEVGADVALLRLSDFDKTNAGIGGRVSYDITRWVSLEGQVDYFPNDDVDVPASSLTPGLHVTYHRRRAEAFFGVKSGFRGDRFGVFGKIRPGFTRLTNQGTECVGGVCALATALVIPEYRTEFALDAGGVFEVYPSRRTVARFELSDVAIRHRGFAPPCFGSGCTSHNLSSRLGVGLRF